MIERQLADAMAATTTALLHFYALPAESRTDRERDRLHADATLAVARYQLWKAAQP